MVIKIALLIRTDIENMVYQGGDDCVALKPNSTSITLRNVTCHGGTGIAFGSIAQYSGVVSDVGFKIDSIGADCRDIDLISYRKM